MNLDLKNRVALIILDGWGIGNGTKSDAIFNANTPYFDSMLKQYPHTEILTHGEHVGLPEGQMGNSEVGHLNIGAGRIVYQDLALINKEVTDGGLANNKNLQAIFKYCLQENRPLHLMGLVSDGGVHSHINHLLHLLELACTHNVKCFVHAFTDGRDTDPKSAKRFIGTLQHCCVKNNATLSSIIGRYYAMDRDKRWERVKIAYDLLTNGKGDVVTDPILAIEKSYADDVTDEFIKPIKLLSEKEGLIKENDAVLCFNFRTDRCREITHVLSQEDMPDYGMKKLNLHYSTLTRYDASFKNVGVLYDKMNLYKTLGEVIAESNRTQLRVAETEKYPHVTFFFNGGREVLFNNESRILVPSPKVATYDLQPEMSAFEITKRTIEAIKENSPDFICLNFANTDMVGHTGVYNSIIAAAESVDQCLSELIEVLKSKRYNVLITADHGNSDYALNEDGTPNTAHSKNPVPLILISNDTSLKCKKGILADIAPTVLQLLNIPTPSQMNGKSLLIDSHH